MVEPGQQTNSKQSAGAGPVPFWLYAFSYLMMGPGVGINCVFIAFAVPATAQFGVSGLVAAFAIGMVLGIPAALFLARQLHTGLSK